MAAGLALEVLGKRAASGVVQARAVLRAAAGLSPEILADIDTVIEGIGARPAREMYGIQAKTARAILGAVGDRNDRNDVLFVALGSSPDKIGFLLECMGHEVEYLRFSRESLPGSVRGGRAQPAFRDLGDTRETFEKHVAAPLRRRFDRAGKGRVAVIDFADTGGSFAAFFDMLAATDRELHDACFPVILADPVDARKELLVNLLRLRPDAVALPVPHDFWLLSKLTRCAARLGTRNDRTLGADVAACNAVRLAVAARVLPAMHRQWFAAEARP